ncbi:MAG: hypothetical protein EOQ80_00945 [Mesorhizobium sp.]|uniref:hypothetical protein n=1 Tax=Mesorhizobium sp. TaxID=1871066 RepID=UPI000FEA11F0|nr:hypothetical protein [Mesorhizobium sp.]RWH51667.1 MAG: hypothetical protein EOQ80_00945 [Mesorhizobium sp.]
MFDRSETAVFPPPGIHRTDSFFARTVPSTREPARLYIGVASQDRGPKLLFLRSMQTLLAGAQALTSSPTQEGEDPADPYLTVLTYFNALRELWVALVASPQNSAASSWRLKPTGAASLVVNRIDRLMVSAMNPCA